MDLGITRFCEEPRNLTMDCSMIEANGILFNDSIDGIAEALRIFDKQK